MNQQEVPEDSFRSDDQLEEQSPSAAIRTAFRLPSSPSFNMRKSSMRQSAFQLREKGMFSRGDTFASKIISKQYQLALVKHGVSLVYGKELNYDKKSLFIFPLEGKVRKAVLHITELMYLLISSQQTSPSWFDRLMLLMIILNSFCLACYDHEDPDHVEHRNKLLDIFGLVFNAIFILECIMKIISKGLYQHKQAYLRDAGNVFDFFIAILAFLEFIIQPLGSPSTIKGLWNMRSLRPIKSINMVPSLRKLVKVLLISLPNLANVVGMLAFIILLFAILGLHQFSGGLYYRCRTTEFPVSAQYWPILEDYERLCYSDESLNSCPSGAWCGAPSDYNISLENDNVSSTKMIGYGVVQFDNIGTSIITVFQVLTMQGWSRLMYNYMDSTGAVFSAIFFCILVIFGSFFLLNLILAVIIDAYMKIDLKEKKKEQEKREQEAIKREKKLEAIRTMFRMTNIFQTKKSIMEAAGLHYRWSFFDVVFELMKVERYDKILAQEVEEHKALMTKSVRRKIKTDLSKRGLKNIKSQSKSRMMDIEQSQTDQHDHDMQVVVPNFRHDFGEDWMEMSSPVQTRKLTSTLFKLKPTSKGSSEFQSIIQLRAIQRYPEGEESQSVVSPGVAAHYQSMTGPPIHQRESEEREASPAVRVKARTSQCKKLHALGDKCHVIIESHWFSRFINVIVILNCICVSTEHYPYTERQMLFQKYVNYPFYFILLTEFIIKLLALGCSPFFKEWYNIYDTALVIIGTADFILSNAILGELSYVKQVFRSTRIFRILKLIRSYKSLKVLFSTIANTVKDLRHFLLLIFIFIFAYTLFGLEFFAFGMKFNEENQLDLEGGVSPRLNFDNFYIGFLTVFTVFQGEQWHLVMYNAHRSVGTASNVFFLILVVCGNIILLKLFLAVLLENFEDKRKEVEKEQNEMEVKEKHFIQHIREKVKHLTSKCGPCNNRFCSIFKDKEHYTSLYIFSENNRLRKLCIYLSHSRVFDMVLLVLILFSSVQLAIETPLDDPNSTKTNVLFYMDIVTTILFVSEVCIKVIANGFILCGPSSYLRSIWNLFDFSIVMISVISIQPNAHSLKILKILRMGRVLRPLRVIGKNEGLKLALQTLFHGIPSIINVGVVAFIFYLIFGVFCVTFVQGRFYSCFTEQLDELRNSKVESIESKWDCINTGGEWMNSIRNYDDMFSAVELLFSISLVNWMSNMFNVVDSVGIDLQPQVNANQYWIIFFVIFMIAFCFFLLNLFVGVVVMTFHEQREKLGKNFLLTNTQKEWLNIKLQLLNTKPVIKKIGQSNNTIRRLCYWIAKKKAFKHIILICIILNTIVLAVSWYEMSDYATNVIMYVNYGFAAIFTVEAVIKITALGKTYFKDNWNKFDFFIVTITIVGIVLDMTIKSKNTARTTVVRAFRVIRIFRILQRAKMLRIIIDTFIITLPSLANVGGLLLLIIYMYSILGVKLFGLVKLQEDLNEQANFQSFGIAFLTLIRILTGEEWDLILTDLITPYSITNQCDPNFSVTDYLANGEINGCGTRVALYYMFSYTLVVTLVFLNLFVAIVLDNFDILNKKENDLLSAKNMNRLKKCWQEFDEGGTHFIEIEKFDAFLKMLGEPLGFNSEEQNSQKLQFDFHKKLELPTYNGFKHYYYYDVILSLTQAAYLKVEARRKLQEQLMSQNINYEKVSKEVLENIKKELEFKQEIFSVHNIEVFKQANEKQKSIYSKMLSKKDELDSQHLWAQNKIVKMYKKTTLHFQHNLSRNKIKTINGHEGAHQFREHLTVMDQSKLAASMTGLEMINEESPRKQKKKRPNALNSTQLHDMQMNLMGIEQGQMLQTPIQFIKHITYKSNKSKRSRSFNKYQHKASVISKHYYKRSHTQEQDKALELISPKANLDFKRHQNIDKYRIEINQEQHLVVEPQYSSLEVIENHLNIHLNKEQPKQKNMQRKVGKKQRKSIFQGPSSSNVINQQQNQDRLEEAKVGGESDFRDSSELNMRINATKSPNNKAWGEGNKTSSGIEEQEDSNKEILNIQKIEKQTLNEKSALDNDDSYQLTTQMKDLNAMEIKPKDPQIEKVKKLLLQERSPQQQQWIQQTQ